MRLVRAQAGNEDSHLTLKHRPLNRPAPSSGRGPQIQKNIQQNQKEKYLEIFLKEYSSNPKKNILEIFEAIFPFVNLPHPTMAPAYNRPFWPS